jgi:hypothetical protein
MKYFLILSMLFISCVVRAQSDKAPTLKSVLLEQLHTTHDKRGLVCACKHCNRRTNRGAGKLENDSTENHSIAQLATHLIFSARTSTRKIQRRKAGNF